MNIRMLLRFRLSCCLVLVSGWNAICAAGPIPPIGVVPIHAEVTEATSVESARTAAVSTAEPLSPPVLAPVAETPGVIGGTCQAPDYWIISTRRCAQINTGAPFCQFDVFRMLPDRKLHRSDQQTFLNSLVPGVPMCIHTHGSFVDWNSYYYDAWYTYQAWRSVSPNRPIQFVFFTWPSDFDWASCPLVDLAYVSEQAALTGIYMAQLMRTIPLTTPVCLVGHSIGAETISAALHLMSGGAVQGYCMGNFAQGRRVRAVMVGAAIEHDWLNPGQLYGHALYGIECLLHMKNHMDIAIKFFPLRRLGSSGGLACRGFTSKDRRLQGWLSRKTREVDVSPVISFHHTWPHYYSKPWISRVIAPYIYF